MKLILFSIFSILVILLFLLFHHSIYQYRNYKLTDGTVFCSKDLDFCLLSYFEKDKKIKKELPYNTLSKDGVFVVKIAIHKNDSSKFIILGSKTIYFGTKFKIIFYFCLLVLSLLSFLYFFQK
jgi:hypothetical protein